MAASDYELLTECCGGSITVEGLDRFRRAIPQYKKFMDLAAQMFAPADGKEREFDEWLVE